MRLPARLAKRARVVIASLSLLLLTACSEAEERDPEIYLLPEGYVGSFHIIFNVPSGEPQTYEEGSRVYRIPENGLLLMKSDANSGRIRSEKINFFYSSNKENRTRIDGRWTTSLHDTPENRSDKQLYVFGGGIGLIEPVRNCQVYSKSFYVGTKSQALENTGYFDIYSNRGLDTIAANVFLNACNES